MKIERPVDHLHVAFPTARGERVRLWAITLPTATMACALRASLISCMGPGIDIVAAKMLLLDSGATHEGAVLLEGLSERDREAVDGATMLLRNARAGRALRGAAGGTIESMMVKDKFGGEDRLRTVPGVQMAKAASMLSYVIKWWLPKWGCQVDTERLYGKIKNGCIDEPGLLWQLLYASNLKLASDSGGLNVEEVNSLVDMGLDDWANGLDSVMTSADELDLLFAFAALHLFRPF